MSNRLDKERESEFQQKRIDYALIQLEKIQDVVISKVTDTTIHFLWKNNNIILYPYSGWHTGKGIKDGRGLRNLLNQLK